MKGSVYDCPNAAFGNHGPATSEGKCPWCGRKIYSKTSMPDKFDESELSRWYAAYYDPDWNGDDGRD